MVRIYTLTKGGGSFRRGYKPGFSNEVFSIYKVDTRLPIPRYYLSDSKNEKMREACMPTSLVLRGGRN